MIDLSIDYHENGQNVKKEQFEKISQSYDGASYKSPVSKKVVNTPLNKEVLVFLAVNDPRESRQVL